MKVNKIIKSTVEEELKITGATLLSIEEVEKYLTINERVYCHWWWLRSPGHDIDYTAIVSFGGGVYYYGYYVHNRYVCVRPALQIKNLKSSNLKIGDIFKINDFEFKIISENLAWMYKQDIGCYAFNEDYEKGNNYETSDVKNFVDNWYETLSNKNTYYDTVDEFVNSKEYRDFYDYKE